jgi:hypothetical protein
MLPFKRRPPRRRGLTSSRTPVTARCRVLFSTPSCRSSEVFWQVRLFRKVKERGVNVGAKVCRYPGHRYVSVMRERQTWGP